MNIQKVKIISVFLIAVFFISIVGSGCLQTNAKENALTIVEVFGPDTSGSLDPGKGWTGWYTRQAGIYETLVSYDEKMNLQAELAKSYTAISQTEWEITLRENVVFHDGTPMNADSILFSFNRVLDPSNSRSSEYSFIKDIRKIDDHTIVIETYEPYAALVPSLTDPLLSIISPKSTNPDKTPIGTGPFKFVSFESGTSLDLVRNENYWNGEVKTEKIHIKYNTDSAARTLMLKSGDVDIARDILPSEYASLNANQSFNVLSEEILRNYFIYINSDKEPFNDVRVRQALSYALNRQEIVDTALEGVSGTPAVGPFTNSLPWNANDKINVYDNNTQKALALFAEAGILPGNDGKLYFKGEPFTIEIQTYTSRAVLPASAEVIASQYEDIGITVSLKFVSGMNAFDLTNYDMAFAAWVTSPTGDPDYFVSSHFQTNGTYAEGWTNYSNAQVDTWIEEARVTFDFDKRKELYDNIQIQTQEDLPLIFVFYGVENYAMTKDVRGFVIYPNEYTEVTKNIYKV
jgi:ABC-type dipeptide transport system, periplasmic component